MAKPSKNSRLFTKFATGIAHITGRPVTFVACCAVILVWALSGPVFRYSDTWQLVVNTGTTVITFLMVFLIQNTQNRDSAALHAKLDELIRASAAQNAFIGIQHLTEEELEEFEDACAARAEAEGHDLNKQEKARVAAEVAAKRARRKAARPFAARA